MLLDLIDWLHCHHYVLQIRHENSKGGSWGKKLKLQKYIFFFKKLHINVMLLTLLHSKCSTESRRSPYLWLEWSWFTSLINSIQRVALNKYSRWMHLSIPRLIWKLQFSSHPFILSVIDITCIDITLFAWVERFARVNTVTIK